MAEWFAIEVLDGPGSARAWADAHGDALVQAGFGLGATDWGWHHLPWGSVLELELPDEAAFERFRDLPAVVAALEAVPDPLHGLLVHRGRGGSSGSRRPRRPLPMAGAGSAALPIPEQREQDEGSEDRQPTRRAILSGSGPR